MLRYEISTRSALSYLRRKASNSALSCFFDIVVMDLFLRSIALKYAYASTQIATASFIRKYITFLWLNSIALL
jgi:hypothetical protein